MSWARSTTPHAAHRVQHTSSLPTTTQISHVMLEPKWPHASGAWSILGGGAMLGFHHPPSAATTSCTLVRGKDSGHMWQIAGKNPLRCNSRRITPPGTIGRITPPRSRARRITPTIDVGGSHQPLDGLHGSGAIALATIPGTWPMSGALTGPG